MPRFLSHRCLSHRLLCNQDLDHWVIGPAVPSCPSDDGWSSLISRCRTPDETPHRPGRARRFAARLSSSQKQARTVGRATNATHSRCSGHTVSSGAVVRWRGGAVVRWCGDAVVRWCGGAVVGWCGGAAERTEDSCLRRGRSGARDPAASGPNSATTRHCSGRGGGGLWSYEQC